ncbi:unnamed protein product [Rodentolepis nana]|uniref:DUF4258 domain-containing protein n=1 Tax=Rodentolepis nana TaxID=102285 RepID=A0A0R3TDS8_RODNA|nr:unnamed protein product [Rodentolepis nana]
MTQHLSEVIRPGRVAMQEIIREGLWKIQGDQININGDPAKREIRYLKVISKSTT